MPVRRRRSSMTMNPRRIQRKMMTPKRMEGNRRRKRRRVASAVDPVKAPRVILTTAESGAGVSVSLEEY